MVSTTRSGKDAENEVAKKLVTDGHRILEMNWRTRWCEIDIVSKKHDTVYFTEVKYRKSSEWGGGLEYIMPKKIKQMRFAADMWMSNHSWRGDAILLGAEVDSTLSIRIVEI